MKCTECGNGTLLENQIVLFTGCENITGRLCEIANPCGNCRALSFGNGEVVRDINGRIPHLLEGEVVYN